MKRETRVTCRLIFGLSLLLSPLALAAQSDVGGLPRRAYFGVALGPADAGVVVTAVADGSSAAAEGIRIGDIIQGVDDMPMRVPVDVVAAMARHAGGQSATLDLVRDGRPERRRVTLRPYPREEMTGVEFEYGSVALDDGSRLRTIVSVPAPRDRRFPGVMLVQGGGCGSIDTPLSPDLAQPGLMRAIGRQGFVTLRVEKSGVGDSRGPRCDEIGYRQELSGYREALNALASHPSVDPERLFLVGISLGGVFAPVLAPDHHLKGMVVFGTLATAPTTYPGRSDRFFAEFAGVDVAAAWKAVDVPVLALHGEFDEVTARADHEQIAGFVNARHPGLVTHRELEGLDHCWTHHGSMEKARGRCGQGDASPVFVDSVLDFLRARAAAPGN